MKIENQVCALDQAKRLKELGVSQNALFVWVLNANWRADKAPTHCLLPERSSGFCKQEWQGRERSAIATMLRETDAAAYTSAELGEMLGSECFTMLEPGIQMHVWHCGNEDYEVLFPADTEAQAKADLLIWLLEKGHRTAAEANAALSPAS